MLYDQFNCPRGITNSLRVFKYKFELQTDSQFNKLYRTTRMTSSQSNSSAACRSSKSTKVIKYIDKTKMTKHMLDSPKIVPFSRRHIDPASSLPSHEVTYNSFNKVYSIHSDCGPLENSVQLASHMT
jgi:hypothetical protein